MLVRLLLSSAAGLLLWTAFPPLSLWWTAPVAVAALVLVIRGMSARGGLLMGMAFGLGLYIPLLNWLGVVVGRDAGIGLTLFSALWMGLIGMLTAIGLRLRWWPMWVASVWVLGEALRSRIPFDGWTWGRLGFSQDTSILLPYAAYAGVAALTFVVALTGSLLAWLVVRLTDRLGTRTEGAADGGAQAPSGEAGGGPGLASGAVATLVGVFVIAALVQPPTQGESGAGPSTRQVGVIQGNVPQAGLDFNAERTAVLNNHVQQTLLLAEDVASGRQAAPDLVLWPENASDIDPYRDNQAYAAIEAAARAVNVPLLVGAVVNDPNDDDQVFNQGIVWDPITGPGESYTKRYLVPFGEYIPFRSALASLISRFDRIPRDFVAGTHPGGLDIGGTRIGDAICFDVAYDRALREAVAEGARFLVVQTNNATYNGTQQPAQQLAMSRVRAVEHGRSVVVVSTSGLSAVVLPDGRIVPGTQTAELVAARYVVEVAQRDTVTVSDRVGSIPEWVIAGLALAAVSVSSLSRRRSKRSESQ